MENSQNPKTNRARSRQREEGFTLPELIVVMSIFALLAAFISPQVIKYLGNARYDAAKIQLKNIENAVELYYLDVGRYPAKESGLDSLIVKPAGVRNWNGPYLRHSKGLNDPWGQKYLYKFPGEHGAYDVFSLGRDGKKGGEGEDRDVMSW